MSYFSTNNYSDIQDGYISQPQDVSTWLRSNLPEQIIPIIVIAYRTKYGSPASAAVVGPAILATLVSTSQVKIMYSGRFYTAIPEDGGSS